MTGNHRADAVGADRCVGIADRLVRQPHPHPAGGLNERFDLQSVFDGVPAQRGGKHVAQFRAPHHDQWLTERGDQLFILGVAQPRTVTPAQRPGRDPTTGFADRRTQAELVERGERVGPDADGGTGRCVGARFDDADFVTPLLQRYRGRQTGDARSDDSDPLGHGLKLARHGL